MKYKKGNNIYVVEFILSQMFSLLGSTVVDYVLIWYVTIKTGSGVMLSTSLVVQFLPRILSAYFLEKNIHKFNLKKLIIVSDIFIAACAFILAIAIILQKDYYFLFLLVLAFRAAGMGVQKPCEKAFMTKIASGNFLLKLNAANAVAESLSTLIAPALGGILVTAVSMVAALMIDLITAFIAVIILCFIKYDNKVEGGCNSTNEKISVRNRVIVWQTLFCFFIIPVAYLTPLLITYTYNGNVSKLSYNEIAYSIGALCSGGFVTIYGKIKTNRVKYVLPVLETAFCTIILSLSIEHFTIYLFMLAIAAMNIGVFQVLIITYIQLSKLKNDKRIFAELEKMSNISYMIGILIWGIISDIMSINKAILCAGIGLIFLSIWLFVSRNNMLEIETDTKYIS